MPPKVIDIGAARDIALRRASYSLRGPKRDAKLKALQTQHPVEKEMQKARFLLDETKDRIVRDWRRGLPELDIARRYGLERYEVESVLWERFNLPQGEAA